MKRRRMIVIGGLLVAILTNCLTGCISKPENPANNAKRVEPPEGLFEPYEEEVVLTTIVEENTGTEFREGDSWDDNTWYRAYKERFNIDVKNLWVSNDYNTKLNLSIADAALPDVFHVSGQQLAMLQKSGLIMDMTDIFDTYASDTLKGYMEREKDTYETGCFDERLYGIPQLSYGIIDQFQYIWIRKDWKDELGLKDPETMSDVIEIAEAFAENYGGYGMAEDRSLQNFFRVALAYGAHPNIWITKENGDIEYGSIQPEMKEALAEYTKWYKEGIVNPNFTTSDQNKMFQDLITGKTGVIPFAQWLGYNPGPDIVKNLGADAIFEPYEIPTATGEEIKGSVSFGNRGYIVVNKNCKNPEAVMKLLNFFCYMMDDAAETETTEFISSLYDNNYPNIPFGLSIINPMTDYEQFVKVKTALEQGEQADISKLGKDVSKYNSCIAWMENQDPNGVGDFLQQGNEKSAYGIAKKYVDNEQYVKNALWGMETKTLLASGSTLNDILIEGFTKIIVGEKSIDYFDTIVNQWKDAGGEKATQEVNATYGNK